MLVAQAVSQSGMLSHEAVREALEQGLAGRFRGQKVLALIPDHTRSLPLPELFRMVVEILHDVRLLDFMVALGTHPPLAEDALNRLVGVTAAERATTYRRIGLLNHAWDDPAALTSLGIIGPDEVRQIAGRELASIAAGRGGYSHQQGRAGIRCHPDPRPRLPARGGRLFGGAKYLFPGISGPDVINATHWLGALATVVGTIGIKETPVRAMINAAARRLPTPVTLAALVVEGHDLAGVFVGDMLEAWARPRIYPRSGTSVGTTSRSGACFPAARRCTMSCGPRASACTRWSRSSRSAARW